MTNWLTLTFFSLIGIICINFIQSQIQYKLLSTYNNTSSIEEPSYASSLYLNFCFSDPPQCFNLLYDSINSMTTIPSKKVSKSNNTFDETKSKYLSLDSVTYLTIPNEGTVSGRKATDRVYHHEPLTFNFFLPDSNVFNKNSVDGKISLLRLYSEDDKNNSIINYFYNCHKIKQRMFAHKYINDNEGILFIGDLGNEIVNQMRTCSFRNKDINQQFWGCTLRYIQIGDNKIITENNDTDIGVVFSVGKSEILAPFEIGKKIIEYYFSLLKMSCYKVDDRFKGQMTLSCQDIPQELLSTLPILTIVLDGYSIVLNKRDLFIKTDSKRLTFSIIAEYNRKDWEIGNVALRNEFMIFDMDKQEVSFVINEPNPNANSIDMKATRIISIIIAILCIVGSIIETHSLFNTKQLILLMNEF